VHKGCCVKIEGGKCQAKQRADCGSGCNVRMDDEEQPELARHDNQNCH